MSAHALEYLALGVAVLALVLVVAEIALKDPGAFREIVTDVAKMARPEPAGAAEIRHLQESRGEALRRQQLQRKLNVTGEMHAIQADERALRSVATAA